MKDGKEEKEENPGQDNLRSLIFIVNGKEITIEKVNLNQPLSVAVEKALKERGIVGRTPDEYFVKWNEALLTISQKVEDFKFPEDAKIFITLKSGEGGN